MTLEAPPAGSFGSSASPASVFASSSSGGSPASKALAFVSSSSFGSPASSALAFGPSPEWAVSFDPLASLLAVDDATDSSSEADGTVSADSSGASFWRKRDQYSFCAAALVFA